ncbi:MAG: hypothetical protein ACTSU5_13715 [Promethearchaeota archaeon]
MAAEEGAPGVDEDKLVSLGGALPFRVGLRRLSVPHGGRPTYQMVLVAKDGPEVYLLFTQYPLVVLLPDGH